MISLSKPTPTKQKLIAISRFVVPLASTPRVETEKVNLHPSSWTQILSHEKSTRTHQGAKYARNQKQHTYFVVVTETHKVLALLGYEGKKIMRTHSVARGVYFCLFHAAVLSSLNLAAQTHQEQDLSEIWEKVFQNKHDRAAKMLHKYAEVAEPMLRAQVLFLEGTLAGTHQTINQDTAVEKLWQARQIYESQNAAAETLRIDAALARLAIREDRLGEARSLLENAIDSAREMNIAEGELYFEAARLALRNDDQDKALVYVRQAISAYSTRSNLHGLAEAKALCGYLLMRTNQLSQGFKMTLTAQTMAVKAGYEAIYQATQVNLALFHALQDLGNHHMYLEVVETYLAHHHDPALMRVLDEVRSFSSNLVSETGDSNINNTSTFTSVEPLPPPEAVPQPGGG